MDYVHNNDAYCTHQKYTKKELNNLPSNAKILELGIGNGSSPLMYEFCQNNPDATVQAFETDSSWFDNMYEQFGDLPNYVFNLIKSWDDLKNHIPEKIYDFIFVDQSPWSARIDSINLLKSKCDLFILHDYDYYNLPEHEWVSGTPKNIRINDDTSWLGQQYGKEFVLDDNYEILPPTLIMRKK
jgi:hypothetical protein